METKTCFKCQRVLPRTEFYAHPQMGDGLLGKCKDCTRSDVRKRYYEKHDDVMLYEKSRGSKRGDGSNKRKYLREYRERYKEKRVAHYALRNAVRDKRIKKMPCATCMSWENVEAHHTDYSKPLDVVWLCVEHHKIAHGVIPLDSPRYRPF